MSAWWAYNGVTFQFHKGAIGVSNCPEPRKFFVEFQFHKGAIGVAFSVSSF